MPREDTEPDREVLGLFLRKLSAVFERHALVVETLAQVSLWLLIALFMLSFHLVFMFFYISYFTFILVQLFNFRSSFTSLPGFY